MSAAETVRGQDASPAAPPEPSRNKLREFFSSKAVQGSTAFVAFIVIFIGFGLWLGSSFVNPSARILDIHQNTPVILLGLAALMTLVVGQFDLSIASMATLTTFLTVGLTVEQELPFALVIVACLLVGVLGGMINALLVVRVKINALIATLGMGGVYLGISAVYSKGTQVVPTEGHALPSWFAGGGSFGSVTATVPTAIVWLAFAAIFVGLFFSLRGRLSLSGSQRRRDSILGVGLVAVAAIFVGPLNIGDWVERIPWSVAFLVIVATVQWVLIDYTGFGRRVRATGSNPLAARLAGVNPDRETFITYLLGGGMAALAGIMLAANQGSASPGIATGYLLPAFAAAFLSTVVLSNGRFHVWGTVIGGIFLVWVSQALLVGGLAFTWTEIVNGLVLVGAVSVSALFGRMARDSGDLRRQQRRPGDHLSGSTPNAKSRTRG